jgi:hypothetical protein
MTLKVATLLSLGQIAISMQASYAQGTMSDRALEKSRFYSAPREYQIVDERPLVRDFREAPANGGQISIPNGPGGGQGAGGLAGIGGGSGANATIPSTGMPLGNGARDPGYRNAPSGMSTLPKSGFGASNIPSGGMGPRGILPGVKMGVVGNVMNQKKPAAAAPIKAVSLKGPSGGGPAKSSAPVTTASYGGYGSHPTSYGNNSRSEQNVRGHLLRSK